MPSQLGDLYDTPTADELASAPCEQLRARVNSLFGLQLKDYWELHEWTCDHPNDYWSLLWDEHGIIGEKGEQPLFDASLDMRESARRSVPRARLNWTENVLFSHPQLRDAPSTPAIICCCEPAPGSRDTHLRTLSWAELTKEVARCANALKALGVKPGDAVAAYTPTNAEAVIAQLAAAAIGAVFSSCPGEFGPSAVLERFTQVAPSVLFTADAYRYNGKTNPLYEKAGAIASALKSSGLMRVVVVGQLSKSREPSGPVPKEVGGIKAVSWSDFIKGQSTEIEYWRGPAMSPLWILFSSGTTGKPKAIVHHAAGMLFSGKSTHAYSTELKPGDVFMQFTTTGWMMWNYMVMVLTVGSTIVCYDGSPFAPMSMLWDLVDEHKINALGISPRYLQVLLSAGYSPKAEHHLTSLRLIGTAGAPVKPDLYDYVKEHVKRLYFNNGTGGTDICNAFIGAHRGPIYKGEIQAPLFGIKLEVWDDEGKPVRDGVEGNMIITRPFVNQPLRFVDDPGDRRYHDAYFNTWPNKVAWNQSDWLVISPKTRGITMLGRSDGVLNPGGVRFGSAELYAVVEELKSDVDDCIAVGQKLGDGDERVILFVKSVEGKKLNSETIAAIKSAIVKRLSTRHVPAVIMETPEIPYTSTAKRVEVAVKKVINGTSLEKINTSALVNPAALQWYVDRPELRLDRAKAKL